MGQGQEAMKNNMRVPTNWNDLSIARAYRDCWTACVVTATLFPLFNAGIGSVGCKRLPHSTRRHFCAPRMTNILAISWSLGISADIYRRSVFLSLKHLSSVSYLRSVAVASYGRSVGRTCPFNYLSDFLHPLRSFIAISDPVDTYRVNRQPLDG